MLDRKVLVGLYDPRVKQELAYGRMIFCSTAVVNFFTFEFARFDCVVSVEVERPLIGV